MICFWEIQILKRHLKLFLYIFPHNNLCQLNFKEVYRALHTYTHTHSTQTVFFFWRRLHSLEQPFKMHVFLSYKTNVSSLNLNVDWWMKAEGEGVEGGETWYTSVQGYYLFQCCRCCASRRDIWPLSGCQRSARQSGWSCLARPKFVVPFWGTLKGTARADIKGTKAHALRQCYNLLYYSGSRRQVEPLNLIYDNKRG